MASAPDLGQPDECLDRLDLTEEGFLLRELVLTPMLQQALSGRRDTPLGGIGQATPVRDVAADLVDDPSRVVFLVVRGQVESVGNDKRGLRGLTLLLLCLGNGSDEFRRTASCPWSLLQWLAFIIQGVMAGGRLIGGVEDRLFVEANRHPTLSCERIGLCCRSYVAVSPDEKRVTARLYRSNLLNPAFSSQWPRELKQF